MSLVPQQDAFLRDVVKLLGFAHDLGFVISGGELFRTIEQQRIHKREGRSKTLDSRHLDRLAIDLNFFVRSPQGGLDLCYDKSVLQDVGNYWESLDPANRWGGNWTNFKDTPHFERQKGFAVRDQTPTAATVAATPDPMPASDPPPDIATAGAAAANPPSAQTTPRQLRSNDRRGIGLLSAHVGNRQPNRRADVEVVQRLLNHGAQQGLFRIEAPLKPDGLVGSKTFAAITACQDQYMGMRDPDGIVSKDKGTLRALCQALEPGFGQIALSLIMTSAKESQLDLFAAPIDACMDRYAINTPLRQAHFLAQIGHESGELRYQEELASGAAYEGRRDLGNTQRGDGKRFKGRGLIQLTGRANYTEYASSLDRLDELIASPTLVATDLDLCVGVAGWYWDTRQLNTHADRDDLRMVTKRINGGFNGLDHRRALLTRAKAVFGLN